MRLKGVGVDGDEKSPLNTSSIGSSPVALWLVMSASDCEAVPNGTTRLVGLVLC